MISIIGCMIVNLPKFFVIGPPHRGISWLTSMLDAHPEIYLPAQENLNYFSNDDFYRKGIGFYYSLYSSAHESKVKGDVCPDYLLYPEKVIKRLRYLYSRDIEDLKFIVYLKNPVVRLLDDFLENTDTGLEELSLSNAIAREDELLRNEQYLKKGMSLGLYANASRYFSLLEPWLKTFKKEQFHFITDLDLAENSEQRIAELFTFLGVTEHFRGPNLKLQQEKRESTILEGLKSLFLKEIVPTPAGVKSIDEKGKINYETRLEDAQIPYQVSEMLYEEVERLERVLNRRLSSWFANAPGVYSV